MLKAEHDLSDAYLRLRAIVGAFDTPFDPTAVEVWAHTEAKAQTVVADAERWRAQAGKYLIALADIATFEHDRSLTKAAWGREQTRQLAFARERAGAAIHGAADELRAVLADPDGQSALAELRALRRMAHLLNIVAPRWEHRKSDDALVCGGCGVLFVAVDRENYTVHEADCPDHEAVTLRAALDALAVTQAAAAKAKEGGR